MLCLFFANVDCRMQLAAKQHVVDFNATEATVAVVNQANGVQVRLLPKSLMLFPPLSRMIGSS